MWKWYNFANNSFNTRRVIEWKVQLYVLEPKLFLELKLAFWRLQPHWKRFWKLSCLWMCHNIRCWVFSMSSYIIEFSFYKLDSKKYQGLIYWVIQPQRLALTDNTSLSLENLPKKTKTKQINWPRGQEAGSLQWDTRSPTR